VCASQIRAGDINEPEAADDFPCPEVGDRFGAIRYLHLVPRRDNGVTKPTRHKTGELNQLGPDAWSISPPQFAASPRPSATAVRREGWPVPPLPALFLHSGLLVTTNTAKPSATAGPRSRLPAFINIASPRQLTTARSGRQRPGLLAVSQARAARRGPSQRLVLEETTRSATRRADRRLRRLQGRRGEQSRVNLRPASSTQQAIPPPSAPALPSLAANAPKTTYQCRLLAGIGPFGSR